jgi:CRP-like cAMP-binding protein
MELQIDSNLITGFAIKKGTVLQIPGGLQSNLYFVKSGLLRSYTIDRKGNEHVFDFAPEGWMISDYKKLKQPNELYIDAIENSVVGIIDRELYEKELQISDIAHIENKYNSLQFLNRLEALQTRIIMLTNYSVIERYEFFIKKYPNITTRVSQKLIASYLGITPESLSRVIKIHFNSERQ